MRRLAGCACCSVLFFAPRAPALNLLTARGGLETAFQKKLKWREEPLRPLPDALILSVHLFCSGPPPKTPDPSRVCGSSAPAQKPKMRKAPGRAAADQAATTTVAAALNSRAPTQPTHHTRAPLQDFADVRSRMATESQRQQRHAAAASHHSADSGSSVFLLRVRIYRIRLRQRCLIIATRPRPVCSESTVVPLSPLDRIPV